MANDSVERDEHAATWERVRRWETWVARRCRVGRSSVEWGEALQVARMSLFECLKSFREDGGASEATWARYALMQARHTLFAEERGLRASDMNRLSVLARAEHDLQQRLRREPTVREVAEHAFPGGRCTAEDAYALFCKARDSALETMRSGMHAEGDEDAIERSVSDGRDESVVVDELNDAELLRRVLAASRSMDLKRAHWSPRHREAWEHRARGLTLSEVGEKLGVTRERARQMVHSHERALRDALRREVQESFEVDNY